MVQTEGQYLRDEAVSFTREVPIYEWRNGVVYRITSQGTDVMSVATFRRILAAANDLLVRIKASECTVVPITSMRGNR